MIPCKRQDPSAGSKLKTLCRLAALNNRRLRDKVCCNLTRNRIFSLSLVTPLLSPLLKLSRCCNILNYNTLHLSYRQIRGFEELFEF